MRTLFNEAGGADVGILRLLFLAGLYVTIFISSFLRGLFFQEELLPVMLLVGVSFALCIREGLIRRELKEFGAPLDWALLALVLAYLMSLINAVHIRDAILEMLKVLVYFMVYWMSSRAVRDEKEMNLFLLIAYLSGVGLACAGLGAASGLIDIAGAYEDGHIRSAMQYHNSLGIYLAALNVIGLGLSLRAKNSLAEIGYLCGNFLIAVVILGTLSRGTWLLYFPAMIAFLLLIPHKYISRALSSLLIFLGSAIFTARFFFNRLQGEQEPSSLGIIAMGFIIIILLYLLYKKLLTDLKPELLKGKKYLLAGISIVLLLLLAYGVFFGELLSHILPANAISRVESSSIESSSVQDRLACYEDALKIIHDYPLTGTGGGGWEALYHSYASRLYWSSEVHSYYLQTWVEAGTIGFLILFLAACLFMQLLLKTRRKAGATDSTITYWATAAGTVLIGLHAVYDMDFSMAAVGFLFYGFIGAFRGRTGRIMLDGEDSGKKGKSIVAVGKNTCLVIRTAAGVMVLLLLVPSSSFLLASNYGERGATALENRKVDDAAIFYKKAGRLDPFKAAYQVNLAQIAAIKVLEGQDSHARDEALKYVRRAGDLEPYSEKMHGALYNILGMLQENEKQIEEARLILRSNPWLAEHYERMAGSTMDLAWKVLQSGERKEAESYFRELLQLHADKAIRLQETTPVLDLAAGQSALMLGDIEKAQELLSRAEEQGVYAYQARLFLAAACSVAGEEQRSQDVLKKISLTNEKAVFDYNLIVQLLKDKDIVK